MKGQLEDIALFVHIVDAESGTKVHIAGVLSFIAYQALARSHLIRGDLIPIFEDYKLPILNAYTIYPKNRFL